MARYYTTITLNFLASQFLFKHSIRKEVRIFLNITINKIKIFTIRNLHLWTMFIIISQGNKQCKLILGKRIINNRFSIIRLITQTFIATAAREIFNLIAYLHFNRVKTGNKIQRSFTYYCGIKHN